MTNMNSTVGTVEFENLINSVDPAVDTFSVKVSSGEGALKRGTVLALNSAGKMVVLGTTETINESDVKCKANCILAEDVDATSADIITIAYRKGHFNQGALIYKTGYTFIDEDKEALRDVGILLSTAV